MKTTFFVTVSFLLAASLGGQAQSSGNAGQQSAATVNTPQKGGNSQLKGKGVPYNKEAGQLGSKSGKKKNNRPIPESTVGTGPDAAASSSAGKRPNTHTAQREHKMGRKDTPEADKSSKANP